MKTMNDHMSEYIYRSPSIYIPELQTRGKMLEQIDIIVKVNVNIYDVSFMNRDVCRVIAQLDDGNLYVKRLEDGQKAIIPKAKVSLPKWEKYKF